MSTIDASGLLKTSSTDANAGDTVAAPVFTSVESDDTVVNSDGSRFETVTTYSQNNVLQSQVITTRAASGK